MLILTTFIKSVQDSFTRAKLEYRTFGSTLLPKVHQEVPSTKNSIFPLYAFPRPKVLKKRVH